MTEHPLTQEGIEELELWRLFTGHDVKHYDDLKSSSLVARVCQGSYALTMSATQSNLYDTMDSFLGSTGGDGVIHKVKAFEAMAKGRMLCSACLIIWILQVHQEAVSISRF